MMNKSRLEAFSDGVIAIIITIVVLELKLPTSYDWQAVGLVLQQLFSYIISFIIIGVFWVNHHHLLHITRAVNPSILWANLFFLLALSLIPYGTKLLISYNLDFISILFYDGLLTASSLAYVLLFLMINKSNEFEEVASDFYHREKRKLFISVFFHILAIPIAFYNGYVSLLIFVLVAIMWVVPIHRLKFFG